MGYNYILGIDPGTEESAYVLFDLEKGLPVKFGKVENDSLLVVMSAFRKSYSDIVLVIEMMKSYGNVMGDSVLKTCVWIGRFLQCWQGESDLICRKEIVTIICKNPRANDSNVRMALIDMYGGKEKAIGNKKLPGVLYGFSGDMWSALAIVLAWIEKKEFEKIL